MKRKSPVGRITALGPDDLLVERTAKITRGAQYLDGLLDALDGADVVVLERRNENPVVMLPWETWLRALVAISGYKSLAPGDLTDGTKDAR